MDRHFLYQSDSYHGWFCGKCGKRLLPDFYNASKHGKLCGFTCEETGASGNVVQDDSKGYRLSVKDGNLLLEICRPELIPIRGFASRFHGMRWITLMEMIFPPDSRETLITKNDSGVDPDLWLSLIRAGRCFRIQKESDTEIIRKVFPGIIGIYSLQMFTHIYRTKGFHHVHLLSESMAQRVMITTPESQGITLPNPQKTPAARSPQGTGPDRSAARSPQDMGGENAGRSPQGTAPDRSAARSPQDMGGENAGRSPQGTAPDRSADRAPQGAGAPDRSTMFLKNKFGITGMGLTPLNASLLLCRDSVYLLRITIIGMGDAPLAFLFSRGYAACTPNADILSALRHNYWLIGDSEKAVREFARLYPEYNLEQYLEKSRNILVPLIAPDYHSLLELASKAAVPSIAENMERLTCFSKDPFLFTNLRDTFRLSLHVLRSLNPKDVTEELLEKLSDINSCHPGLLQFDTINHPMSLFYQDLDITVTPIESDASASEHSTNQNIAAAQGRRTVQYITPAQGRRTAKNIAPAPERHTAQNIASAQGRRTAQNIASAQGRRTAQNIAPAPGRRTAQNIASAQGRRTAQNIAPAPGRRTAQNIAPAQGRRTAQNIASAQGRRTVQNIAPAPGRRTVQNIASAQGRRTAQNIASAQGRRTAQNIASAQGRRTMRSYHIFGLDKNDLTDAQILQILRFLKKAPAGSDTWQYLKDYMTACEQLGEWPYGLTPKIPIRQAHNRVVQRIRLRNGDPEQNAFNTVVSSPQYLSLRTDRTEEDKELFRDDPFIVISPAKKEDLFEESESMHNCVRIYARAVIRNSSKIYFLRQKEAPALAYGTIEVQGNRLIQAKAFANKKLSKDAQAYIRKWCHVKHLHIRTCDIEPT